MMAELFPEQRQLGPETLYRVNRARLALRLGVLPSAIDEAPAGDIEDLIATIAADEKIAKVKR